VNEIIKDIEHRLNGRGLIQIKAPDGEGESPNRKAASRRPFRIHLIVCSGDRLRLPLPALAEIIYRSKHAACFAYFHFGSAYTYCLDCSR
jgi:hypothetical protein